MKGTIEAERIKGKELERQDPLNIQTVPSFRMEEKSKQRKVKEGKRGSRESV